MLEGVVGQPHAATAVLRSTLYRRLDVVRYGSTLVEDYRIFGWIFGMCGMTFGIRVSVFITQDMAM